MTTAPIPSYPVIYVNVRADGSAHLNVAGQHIDYPAAPVAETRSAVTRYAVEMAITLGRAVRMTTTDPVATFEMAAHPDGTVTDLTPDAPRSKRARRPAPVQKETAAPTIEVVGVLPTAAMPERSAVSSFAPPAAPAHPPEELMTPPPPPPPAPAPTDPARPTAVTPVVPLQELPDEDEATRVIPRRPIATLTFSTGETIQLRGSALIGRRPAALEDEQVDQLALIDDPTRTVSKTHARIEWHDDALWIADRASANGTALERGSEKPLPLVAWEPHQLLDNDAVHLGKITFTLSIRTTTRAGNRS